MAFAPLDWLVTGACTLASVPFRIASETRFDPPEHLLIIKPCCIGDVLMATPVAAALARAFPGIQIDWAVGPWARSMVEHNPRLNQLINAEGLGAGSNNLGQARRLASRIRNQEYDTCLVLDRSPLLAAVPWWAQIPQRIGLNSQGRGFCHHLSVPVRGIQHEAELYLSVARAMGVNTQGVRTEFYPSDKDREQAAELLESRIGWQEGDPLFIFHPAGGRNPGMKMLSKRWPPERYAVVANRLINTYGGKGLLLGGPKDKIVLDAIKGLIGFETLTMAGEIEWGVLAALQERASLCIGNDTGATHLAVAVGCKTIFIFGPSDPRRYGPFAQPGQAAALWHPIPELVQGVRQGTPRGWSWDEGVTADEAWHTAQALMESDEAVSN